MQLYLDMALSVSGHPARSCALCASKEQVKLKGGNNNGV